MKVGLKAPNTLSPVIAERTRTAVDYALSQLKSSKVYPYIRHVYLYGSCARKMQSYESDVDLLVEFAKNMDVEKFRHEIMDIKSKCASLSTDFPDVDVHITVGPGGKDDKLLYYQNIRKEGIDIWDSDPTHT